MDTAVPAIKDINSQW